LIDAAKINKPRAKPYTRENKRSRQAKENKNEKGQADACPFYDKHREEYKKNFISLNLALT
jgi:hypothetical protein